MDDPGMQVFARVWDALETSPEDAATLKLRADLMAAVRAAIDGWRLTRLEAEQRLGLTSSRLDDLLQGRIDALSLDDLVALATRVGVTVRVDAAAA